MSTQEPYLGAYPLAPSLLGIMPADTATPGHRLEYMVGNHRSLEVHGAFQQTGRLRQPAHTAGDP